MRASSSGRRKFGMRDCNVRDFNCKVILLIFRTDKKDKYRLISLKLRLKIHSDAQA